MTARFYAPQPYSIGESQLSKDIAHHAFRVCRIKTNEPLILFNGNNQEALAVCIDPSAGIVEIQQINEVSRESPLNTLLIQALPALDKMEFVIQKAVELGVNAIQPVKTMRSIIRLDEARSLKKQQHWEKIILSACEQSGRTQIPALYPICDLNEAFKRHDNAQDAKWVLCPHEGAAPSKPSFLNPTLQILIGPEGGFDETEYQLAKSYNFTPVQLGPRVLRTETAGLAALAIAQSLFGDVSVDKDV